jgi:hypothetical protein
MTDENLESGQLQQTQQAFRGPKEQLDLIAAEGIEGKFANYLIVSHSSERFLMDFSLFQESETFLMLKLLSL